MPPAGAAAEGRQGLMTAESAPVAAYPGIAQAIGLALAVLLLQVVIGGTLGIFGPRLGLGLNLAAMIGFANLLAFGLVIWWAVRASRLPVGQALPFRAVPGILYLPLTLLVLGLGIVASEVDNLFRSVVPVPDFLVRALSGIAGGGAASIVTVVVIAPLVEEMLFRGTMLRGFLGRYRPGTAVLVSALIFGLIHLNPYQFFSALVLGVVLGWIFLYTRSLWPCIFGHALFNGHAFVLATLLPFEIPGYNPSGGDLRTVEFQPLWFDILGLGAAVIGLVLLARLLGPGRVRG